MATVLRGGTAAATGKRGRPAWPPGITLAGAWSLVYGLLGLHWAFGGAGFPFGESDPGAEDGLSLFVGLDARTGGAAIAALGLVGAAVAVMLAAPIGRRFRRAPLGAFAWGACAALLLAAPDVRLLQTLAYGLFLRFDRLDWPVVNQAACAAGGLLWGIAALEAGDRGVPGGAAGNAWTSPAAAARWGRWATAIAVVAPLPYGIVRLAWFRGIPLGVSEAFVVGLNRDADAHGGGFLKHVFGSEAFVAALLTLGLVQRWGEAVPRWVPALGGRRAPVWLAVAPASVVAIAVTAAGRAVLGAIVRDGGIDPASWGLAGPALLWLVWGVALGAATLAYYLRRRSRPGQRGGGSPAPVAIGNGDADPTDLVGRPTAGAAASGVARRRWRAGPVAAAWAVLFAAPHVWWAFGIPTGFPGGAPGLRAALAVPWFLAYDLLVVALSGVAALVALATVRPWGVAVPGRILTGAAWCASGMLLARGLAGFAIDGQADPAWWPTFAIGGLLFGATAWGNRCEASTRPVRR